MKLADYLDGGFGGFGAAGGEVDAAVCKIWRSERKKACCEFLGGSGMELRCVSESDLRGLCGHGFGDFSDAVTNVDDGGLARCIEKSLTV